MTRRAESTTDKSKQTRRVIDTIEDFKPYAQSVLVFGSFFAAVWFGATIISGLQGELQKLKVEMNEKFKTTDEKFKTTDEKIGKVAATTDEKISKVAATTDEKIGKVRAEAELKSTENFLRYNNDESFVTLRRQTTPFKDLKPGK